HGPPPAPPYTLSLHDALPIWFSPYVTARSARSATVIPRRNASFPSSRPKGALYMTSTLANGRGRQNRSHDSIHHADEARAPAAIDRKSTRLNSSHLGISYAVF